MDLWSVISYVSSIIFRCEVVKYQGRRVIEALEACAPQTVLFDVPFPEKLLKIIATRGEIFSLKFTKYRLAAGLRPDPLGELKRSPKLLGGFMECHILCQFYYLIFRCEVVKYQGRRAIEALEACAPQTVLFDVSFPEKLLKIVATRGEIFSLKFTKYRLAAGLRPDPLVELKRSPRPPSRNKGALLLRGGEGKGGILRHGFWGMDPGASGYA